MTTRAPGLTASMRKWAEVIASGGDPYAGTRPGFRDGLGARRTLYHNMKDRGLIAGVYRPTLTPRGHAALAAPRMTAAELEILEGIERGSTSYQYKHQITALLFNRLRNLDWITLFGDDDELDTPTVALTKAGLTALNNMRAAMGSAEYKETV